MAEELDDFKALWQKSKEQTKIPVINLEVIEKYRPKTTLYWIKFILWIEFGLNILFLPFVIYYLMDYPGGNLLLISYLLVTSVYLVYYLFLIRSIIRFRYDEDVIHNLQKVYRYLSFYLLHYKVVIWFSLIGGFAIGLYQGFEEAINQIPEGGATTFWLVVFGLGTLFIGLIGGIFHFLIHLIYGRKIKRLKKMVQHLQSEA